MNNTEINAILILNQVANESPTLTIISPIYP